MMTFLASKKAQAFVWFGVMVIIFLMGLFFTLLNEPMDSIRTTLEGNLTGTDYEPTYNKLTGVWDIWLIIFLFAMLIFGILSAMRRKQYEG